MASAQALGDGFDATHRIGGYRRGIPCEFGKVRMKPLAATQTNLCQSRFECLAVFTEEIAEQVILAALVLCGNFHAIDDLERPRMGCTRRLASHRTGDRRVVIGDRNRTQTRQSRIGDDLRGREIAIAVERVYVQIGRDWPGEIRHLLAQLRERLASRHCKTWPF